MTIDSHARQRDPFYDTIKCLAIFLVILGHTIQYLESGMAVFNSPFGHIMGMVNMPLFMFICGFFSISSLNKSFKTLLINKIKSLFIPMLIYCVFAWILILVHRDFSTGIVGGGKLLIYSILGQYWFIYCVLDCIFYAYIFLKIPIKLDKGIILLISWFILLIIPRWEIIPAVNEFKAMYPFFILGWMSHKNGWIKAILHNSLISIIIILPLFCLSYYFFKGDKTFYYFSLMTPEEIVLPYINMLIGGISCIVLCFIIVHHIFKYNVKHFSYLAIIGQYTLAIYMMQGLIFNYLYLNPYYNSSLGVQIIFSIFIFIICGLFSSLFAKNRLLSKYLLGKS